MAPREERRAEACCWRRRRQRRWELGLQRREVRGAESEPGREAARERGGEAAGAPRSAASPRPAARQARASPGGCLRGASRAPEAPAVPPARQPARAPGSQEPGLHSLSPPPASPAHRLASPPPPRPRPPLSPLLQSGRTLFHFPAGGAEDAPYRTKPSRRRRTGRRERKSSLPFLDATAAAGGWEGAHRAGAPSGTRSRRERPRALAGFRWQSLQVTETLR